MNHAILESLSIPRIAILASALLSVILLIAAPNVLPHTSAAETSSPKAITATHLSPSVTATSFHPKPSAAHRAARPVSAPRTAAPGITQPIETTDSQAPLPESDPNSH